MVDKVVLAAKIAAVRDAVGRVRAILPGDPEVFFADRTAREVVVFNLFVALQECLALATHRLADDGLHVPNSCQDVFLRLGERAVIAPDLAARLAAASGFRNLVGAPVRIARLAAGLRLCTRPGRRSPRLLRRSCTTCRCQRVRRPR